MSKLMSLEIRKLLSLNHSIAGDLLLDILGIGEEKLVAILGGVHIEKATIRATRAWVAGSGWVNILSHAGITTAGRAE